MEKMDANAQMKHIGMEIGVRMLDALVDNTMMENNVCVRKANISMEAYAYYALMDSYGTKNPNHVFALSTILGMEIGVKNQSCVREIEFGILSTINVCVEMDNFGMVLSVRYKRSVMMVKSGI